MKYQITTIGNYLKIKNLERDEYFYGFVKDVFIDKNNTDTESYRIFNVKDLKDSTILSIGKLYKENGSLFTKEEFEDFYTNLKQQINTTVGLTNTELREEPINIINTIDKEGLKGTSVYKLITTTSTNSNTVKSTGGNVYSIVAIGLTTVVRYLKLYNKNTEPLVGIDNPIMTIPVPTNTQGAGVVINIPNGINFPEGISLAITSGVLDNDNQPVEAADVVLNLIYA